MFLSAGLMVVNKSKGNCSTSPKAKPECDDFTGKLASFTNCKKIRPFNKTISLDICPSYDSMISSRRNDLDIPERVKMFHYNMMWQCYGKKKDGKYGHKYTDGSVYVCEEWWDVNDFYKDVKLLPNFEQAVENGFKMCFSLAPFKANAYTQETLTIIPKDVQQLYNSRNVFKLKYKNEHATVLTVNAVAKALKRSPAHISTPVSNNNR